MEMLDNATAARWVLMGFEEYLDIFTATLTGEGIVAHYPGESVFVSREGLEKLVRLIQGKEWTDDES